jgi:ectoine utilization protein EutD
MLPFNVSEYQGRLDATRRRMEAAGIEVLISADPANINYLTGYDGWSFYVPQAVIVALDQEQPLWVGRAQDGKAAQVTTFLDDANIIGYPDDYVQSAVKHPMNFVADLLEARGWNNRTVGVEKDAYYYSVAGHEALVRDLPDAVIKDASLLVNWVRAVKSPREIQYMREAARIMEAMMQVAVDAVSPGTRQCDAVGLIYQAQVRGTPEHGGEYASIVPLLPTGAGTSTPHLAWNDTPFVKGEATILELGACRHRYHCPMARTVHLGAPPQSMADAAEVVVEGLNAALEAARPGVTCEAVEAAWRAVIAKSGIKKDSRIGYSTGLNYPPDWGEHTMSLRPGDKTVLQPNMTLHLIPAIWTEDWGIEISECIRVTESGAEAFCDFPRKLLVKV